MPSPRSPQSLSRLFGGPGFLALCLLILAAAGAVAYFALREEGGAPGAATIVLPAGIPNPLDAAPGAAPASNPAGQSVALQSMPAAPVAKEMAVSVAIEEDLSPAALLAKYPPDPAAALSVAVEGAPAWRRFARDSAVSRAAPRVALVITGLGRNRIDTVRAITGAPPEASLSFDGESAEVAEWIAAARAYGHEALLDLPLSDGAPTTGLGSGLEPAENLRRLQALLARAPMIAGVAIGGGESFLADAAALQPLLDRLRQDGLAVVGLPVTAPLVIAADEVVHEKAEQAAIERAIDSLMGVARQRGAALGLVDAGSAADLFPAWQRALVGRDEIALVPATALVEE